MSPEALLAAHLAVVGSTVGLDGEGADPAAVYHEGVTVEFPYAPEGHTRRLEGRDAVLRYFGNIPNFAADFRVGPPTTVLPLPDGLVAIYPGGSTFKESGKPYAQEYVAFLTVEEGKIAKIVEYYDGQRVLRALGELD